MQFELSDDDLNRLAQRLAPLLLSRIAPEEKALPERKAAERLHMSYWTLRDLRIAGKVNASKIGRSWFYEPKDLDALLASGRAP